VIVLAAVITLIVLMAQEPTQPLDVINSCEAITNRVGNCITK
jgi:hypothetical protein